jgi:hypothetical protein
MRDPKEDELKRLAERLFERRHEASIVDRARAAFEGVLRSELKQCHANASTWAENNEGWHAVRGWVVFDFTNIRLFPRPYVHFAPHSVVRDANGKLWDITPNIMSYQYPFFPHPGTDAEFVEIVERHKLDDGVDYFVDEK